MTYHDCTGCCTAIALCRSYEDARVQNAYEACIGRSAGSATCQMPLACIFPESLLVCTSLKHLTCNDCLALWSLFPLLIYIEICCLQDSRARITIDMERARREGFKFGAKLVRGAYMFMENARAKQKGFPSPVWPSKQDTHDNYDA